MQAVARLQSFPTAPRTTGRAAVHSQIRHAAPLPTLCCNCSLRKLCVPCGLGEAEMKRMDELIFTRQRVRSGEHVYRARDKFASLYAVRSGFFKSSLTLEDGRDQVTGFFMAGEVMGMDGIEEEEHTCDVVALEDSEVCVIPFAHLERMSREIPALQQHFHRMMGREIMRDHGIMLLLGSMRAQERLAGFLLNLSKRYAARGYSATQFNLRTTREDIASYLGLKLETVSRTFSRFQQEGLIAVQLHKKIEIKNLEGLKAVIGDNDRRRSPAARRANDVVRTA